MYILKNAVKNLLRNKGRNIIVSIIILAMLTFTAISMIINTTTDNIMTNYKEQFGSVIYIQTDVDKLKDLEKNGAMAFAPEIPDKIKLDIADSVYLKETMLRAIYPAYSPDLKGVGQGETEIGGNIQTSPIQNSGYYDINLRVIGYNMPELMTDFKEGKRKITDGKMFLNDNECVISEDFAKLNNLKTGDKIKISDCDKSSDFEKLELTVVGIFFDETVNEFGFVSAATNPRNDILTTYNTMKHYEDIVAKGKNLYAVDATYYLKSPDLVEAFNKEAHQKGLDEIYTMATDEMSYNKIVKPAESLANVSNIFLIAVLIIGSIILILLSILSIRERKYEIGVLRAMGMKKLKVVRGILYESLITISVCLIVGLSIGAMAAQPVADMITEKQQEQSLNNSYMPQFEQEEIKVALTPQAVINVSVIALALAIISSSVGVLYILRYEPMKILSERN